MAISGDGNTIVSGSGDRTIEIWDLNTETLEQSLKSDRSDKINSIAVSSDARTVVSGGEERTIAIWHLK